MKTGRRIIASAPYVAFLDSASLTKVAPIVGKGSKCRRQYWTCNIGEGADFQIGTARTTIIALHFAPGYWYCATADMASRQLVYYDPFYAGPDRARALNALSAYVDQVTRE